MSRSGAAASIVVERAFDGLALVVVTLLISLLFPREHFLGVAAFLTGLVFLRLEAGGYTVVIWVLEASAMTLAVLSFGIALPLAGFLLIYGLAALGTTLPSGPGYVGPYQYAFVLSLGVFEVSRETALAVSIATQIALLGSVTVIGLALLWREHLRPAPERKEETG